MRLTFSEANRIGEVRIGGVYCELDDWSFEDWGMVVLRVRAQEPIVGMMTLFELDGDTIPDNALSRLLDASEIAPMFVDGNKWTYAFPVPRPEGRPADESWTRLAIAFLVSDEAIVDVLSVRVVPAAEPLTG